MKMGSGGSMALTAAASAAAVVKLNVVSGDRDPIDLPVGATALHESDFSSSTDGWIEFGQGDLTSGETSPNGMTNCIKYASYPGSGGRAVFLYAANYDNPAPPPTTVFNYRYDMESTTTVITGLTGQDENLVVTAGDTVTIQSTKEYTEPAFITLGWDTVGGGAEGTVWIKNVQIWYT